MAKLKKKEPSRGEQPYPDHIFPDPSNRDSILFRDNRFPGKVYHYSGYLHGETAEWVEGEDLKGPEPELKPQEDWRVKMRKEHEEELERSRKRIEEEERIRAEKVEMKKARRQKLEEERLERERIEEERLEQERFKKKRLEQQRLEQERIELEKLKLEQKRLEDERLRQEKLQQEKLERERLELERARLKLEKQKLEKERRQQERLRQEELRRERFAQQERERDRLLKERLEKERLEKERLAKERLEQQRLAKLEQDRLNQEKLEQESLEQERLQEARVREEKLQQEKLEQQKLEQQKLEQQRLERQRLEQEKLRQTRLEQLELEKQRLKQQRLEEAIREEVKREEQAAKARIPDEDTFTRETPGAAPPPRQSAWLGKVKAVAIGLLKGSSSNPVSNLILPFNDTADEEITTTPRQNKPTLKLDLDLDLLSISKDQTLISDLTSPSTPLLQPLDSPPTNNNLPTSASSSPPSTALAANSADREIGFAPKSPHFRVPYARSTCEQTLYTTHHTTTLPGPSPHLLTPELSICWFFLFLFLFPRVLVPLPLRELTFKKTAISSHNQKSWRYLQNFLRATVVVWLVYVGYMCFLEWLTEEDMIVWWDDDAPRVWYCGCDSWPVFKPLEILGWCERRA